MSTLTVNNLYIGSNQGFTTMGDVIGTSLSTILLYTGVEYATNIYASSLVVSSILAYSNQGIIMSSLQLNISSINGQLFGVAPTVVNVVSTANLANLVSTANLANLVSTANLANLVSTTNLANLVSTANLANLVSTANLANFVSTSYLATQLSSTIRGITSTFVISSLVAQNINSVQGYVSSLVVDSLQLGSNTAYIYMGDVIATSLSTVYVATGSLTTPRISAQQLFVSSIAINCNAPVYAMDINANFRVNSNSFLTGGLTSYMSNSGLFSNAATATFASNILQTQGLAYLSNAGIFSNASNVFFTGGATSYLSNSGQFSNVATATFASNVLHTGGATSYLSNSGLFSNVGNSVFTGTYLSNSGNLSNGGFASFFAGVNVVASALTASNSSSPVTFSNATSAANYVLKCEMTGANLLVRQAVNGGNVAVIENTGGGALLINPGGASVSIGSSNASYMLDVAGIARSGIPVSSLTGTSATFGANAFGIYYYITNSAFSNIGLYNTSGGATGTGGTAPPIGTGWYVTLRNNTGSYLSITVNGLLASTPASPFTIPPSNSVTIAYDSNLAGGAGYVFF
jgi:hypothetical protein